LGIFNSLSFLKSIFEVFLGELGAAPVLAPEPTAPGIILPPVTYEVSLPSSFYAKSAIF
jgi:hypothetical protein